MKFSGSQWA
ncbi:hypothetical protein N499_0767A, partial [Wolbachia pipientis wVitA]